MIPIVLECLAMADVHRFDILCRVCGGRLQRAKKRAPVHKCTNHTEGLEATFGISVGTDDPDVHPEFFCNRCFAAIKRQSTAASKGIPYHHSIDVNKTLREIAQY